MCNFKSALILKDSVFVPNYDSHDDMLKELKIKDTKENAERLFVRAELVPSRFGIGKCKFEPVEDWKFVVDQDILPDWFVREIDEERMRKAVSEWVKKHMFVGEKDLEFSDDDEYYVEYCSVVVRGKAKINAYDSVIKAYDNSLVMANNLSAVIAYDKAAVSAFNHSVVYAYDYSEIHAADESSIYAYDNSRIHSFGNSIVESHDNSVVEHYSNFKIHWCLENCCFYGITKR